MAPSRRVPVRLGDGTKKRYLRYDARALVRLEEELGVAPTTALQRAAQMSMKALCTMVWAGLLHDEPDLTVDEVIDTLFDTRHTEEVSNAATDALLIALGRDEDQEEKGGKAKAGGKPEGGIQKAEEVARESSPPSE